MLRKLLMLGMGLIVTGGVVHAASRTEEAERKLDADLAKFNSDLAKGVGKDILLEDKRRIKSDKAELKAARERERDPLTRLHKSSH